MSNPPLHLHGPLGGLAAEGVRPVRYRLEVGDGSVALDAWYGAWLRLSFSGVLHCVGCGRVTPRSFAQGHCWRCFRERAACDLCVVSPDRCHFAAGTCREPDWGLAHCMQPHWVYLANSSGLKVGITRASRIPGRWIDQGAVQGRVFARTTTRRQAGRVEKAVAQWLPDRTDWKRMLQGVPPAVDLGGEVRQVLARLVDRPEAWRSPHAEDAVEWLPDGPAEAIEFAPPLAPVRLRALAVEVGRPQVVEDRLIGAKGQYLLFDGGVLNVRRCGGLEVLVEPGTPRQPHQPRQGSLFD